MGCLFLFSDDKRILKVRRRTGVVFEGHLKYDVEPVSYSRGS